MSERLEALFLAATQHWDGGRWAEAISLFQEIVRLDPNSPEARYHLGVACLSVGRLAEAAASLERAAELKPNFDRALSQLAFALLRQGREPEALLVYRKLSRVADDRLARLHFSALALEMEGKEEEGENELRRLVALAPELAQSRALLGEFLSKRGEFEEAALHLAEAAEVFPPAFEQLTAVKRMTEADRPLMDRMRVLAERPGLDAMLRIRLEFGLGKAFDDLGDYAEAMRHYEAANRLKAMSARLDRPALAAKYDNIISGFTAEALQSAQQRWPCRRVLETTRRCSSSACPAPGARSSSRSCLRIPRSPPAAN
jgi:Flp pilus assembly protein TadD